MFCPACASEYRPGFTRCASCDVDLVDRLPEKGVAPPPPRGDADDRHVPGVAPLSAVELCGFLSFEEAMAARAQLRAKGIRSEIVVREDDPGTRPQEPSDTFWLRVAGPDLEGAVGVLGYPAGTLSGPESETIECSECGRSVAAEETFCPHCGARFENA